MNDFALNVPHLMPKFSDWYLKKIGKNFLPELMNWDIYPRQKCMMISSKRFLPNITLARVAFLPNMNFETSNFWNYFWLLQIDWIISGNVFLSTFDHCDFWNSCGLSLPWFNRVIHIILNCFPKSIQIIYMWNIAWSSFGYFWELISYIHAWLIAPNFSLSCTNHLCCICLPTPCCVHHSCSWILSTA